MEMAHFVASVADSGDSSPSCNSKYLNKDPNFQFYFMQMWQSKYNTHRDVSKKKIYISEWSNKAWVLFVEQPKHDLMN